MGKSDATRPSVFESEMHPSHKSDNLFLGYFALLGADRLGNEHEFISGALWHHSRKMRMSDKKKSMEYRKKSFIGLQKLTDVKGRIDYISSPDRQENLYAIY